MQKKIRTHTTQKVPFQLIAGEQDRAGRHRELPVPRRHPGQRRRDRRGRAPHPRARSTTHARSRLATTSSHDERSARRVRRGPDRFVGRPRRRPRRVPATVDAAPHRVHRARPAARRATSARSARRPRWTTSRRSSCIADARAYVLLNLFPYNSGHLLVVPYRHVATYDEATRRRGRRDRRAHADGDAGRDSRCRSATASTSA